MWTPERRRKMSEFMSNRTVSPETRERIRAAKLGLKASDETKRRMSAAHKGIKPNLGRRLSPEWRKHIAESGKGRPVSMETRHKLREVQKRLVAEGRHPFWKGGIYPANEAARDTLEYREWRRQVFARDNYKCRMPNCTTRDKYVEANHIKRFADYPLLRNEVSNGITLCRPCHDKTKGHEQAYEALFNSLLGL